jgi:hypothetical protein
VYVQTQKAGTWVLYVLFWNWPGDTVKNEIPGLGKPITQPIFEPSTTGIQVQRVTDTPKMAVGENYSIFKYYSHLVKLIV